MHADRSRAGKQGKVPNLPEKTDSTSPSETVGRQGGWLLELGLGMFWFLIHFYKMKTRTDR